MSEIHVENKQVVVPGQLLAQGFDYVPGIGAYRLGEQVIAERLGLVSIDGRAIKLIPLAGRYIPKKDDVIIGKVTDILMSGWKIDIHSAYTAMLSLKEASDQYIEKGYDLNELLTFDEYILCRVSQVTSQNLIDVSMRSPGLFKLPAGIVLHVVPSKVPRIIGKQGSMVSLLKEYTGCNVVVGQNGRVWISGTPQGEHIAIETIRIIEKYAHVSGLTDAIKAHLEKTVAGLDLPKAEDMDVAVPNKPRFQKRRFERNDRYQDNGNYKGGRHHE
ncbi:MAG: exosome complex RNA-binding protein Rrp4 [Candidatus Woesearchaeota archaeon]